MREYNGTTGPDVRAACAELDFLYAVLLQNQGKNDMIITRETGTFLEKGRHFGG